MFPYTVVIKFYNILYRCSLSPSPFKSSFHITLSHKTCPLHTPEYSCSSKKSILLSCCNHLFTFSISWYYMGISGITCSTASREAWYPWYILHPSQQNYSDSPIPIKDFSRSLLIGSSASIGCTCTSRHYLIIENKAVESSVPACTGTKANSEDRDQVVPLHLCIIIVYWGSPMTSSDHPSCWTIMKLEDRQREKEKERERKRKREDGGA